MNLIRKHQSEILKEIELLRLDIDKLEILLKSSNGNMNKFYYITQSLIGGFTIVNEKEGDWCHMIGTDTYSLFKYIKELNITNDVVNQIKKSCANIFHLTYGRDIEQENLAPDMIGYFWDARREPYLLVVMTDIFISIIISSMYGSIRLCYHNTSIFDVNMYDVIFPLFYFSSMSFLFAEKFNAFLSKKIFYCKWKLHWLKFKIPSMISSTCKFYNKKTK